MANDVLDEKTSENSRARASGGLLGVLRAVALISVIAGAAGSLALVLRAGRHNDSRLLVALFDLWVLSPFAALALAGAVSKRWSAITRATLYCVMLVLPAVSLAMYGNLVPMPKGSPPASRFLIVPLASWLLMIVIVPLAARMSAGLSRRSDGNR
jgi:hypothetical protein